MTCGVTFEAALKQGLLEWQKDRTSNLLSKMQGTSVILPFIGIIIGTWLFLGSGLSIFGLPSWLAVGASFVLTVFTSFLIWKQLGELLIELQRGGSRALDLDLPE
nr:hypothetical protein [Oscillatoria sp. FACHB-1406]